MTDLQQVLKGKTPVSVLQEICSKRKLTATYDVLANEGPVHEPVFVMRAQAGDFQGTGKGSSKKKAKHNAASRLLCSMHGIPCEIEEDSSSTVAIVNGMAGATNGQPEVQGSPGAADGDAQGNPIGELQEYTQKNVMKPPLYEFIGEQGPPHAKEFVCTVRLAKLQETAVGKSKKIAKRAAASKLLQAVRQLHNDTTSTAMLDEEEEELPLPISSQQASARRKHIAEAARMASEFYEKLKHANKAPGSSRTLHSSNLNSGADNFCKLLEDLAKEKRFDVRYLDIKEKSYSGQYQCLVQLSTGPIAVCHGTGMTVEEAHTSAAHNALQYLKSLKSWHIPVLTFEEGQQANGFLEKLSLCSKGDVKFHALQLLHSSDLNHDTDIFCRLSEDLAVEMEFDVGYQDIEEKLYSGML